MKNGYVCSGSVRGECGHVHRTLRGAARCLARDQRGCRSQGGYSDRHVRHADGGALDRDDYDTVNYLIDNNMP